MPNQLPARPCAEPQAAEKLLEAAQIMSKDPGAMQLRYLSSLNLIAGEKSSTIIFPFSMERPAKGSSSTLWRSCGEDADAQRRLFYVAMTRAKSMLTVLTNGQHAFVRPGDAILPRHVTPDKPNSSTASSR